MPQMASISTCFFITSTPKYKLKPHSTAFFAKPSIRLHTATLHFNTSLKLHRSIKRSPIKASFDIATTAARPGGVIESDKLPSDVRKRAMSAVDSSGGRVTVGDVASKAGLKLDEAQKALQALAADTDGFLEVSDDGDVLYVFPGDYRSKLAAKSIRLKIEPLLDKAKLGTEYVVRVSFGTALIASIVIVFTAIVAILSSSRSEDNNRNRRSRSFDGGFMMNFYPTDLFWYWDPYYYRRRRMRDDSGETTFIESVFSFVFGDGDPNQGIEEERWKLIGEYIASNGGVVTAEEIAPYLDVETADKTDDDSYILPVLLRFDGLPEIDEEGNILYRFPSLQRTATPGRRGMKEYVGRKWADLVGGQKFFKENKWRFSKTSSSERAMVFGLGGLNLFGVIVLGTMLKSMSFEPQGFISFVASIFPALQIYAGSFFAIPLVRWFFIQRTNANIEKRNKARELRAQALELPDLSLRRKLLSARDMAQRTYIGKDRIVYSTDKDLAEQDYDAREFDRRLRELEKTD